MKNHVLGFWKLKSIRTRSGDVWETEKVLGGMAAFDESHIVYLYRTDEALFGCSGPYRLDGDRMEVRLDTCTFDHLEGQTVHRSLTKPDPDTLVFTGEEVGTARTIEVAFERA